MFPSGTIHGLFPTFMPFITERDHPWLNMTIIPDFKTPEDENAFYQIFEEKLQERVYLIKETAEALFPKLKLVDLDSRTLKLISDLTESLLYSCTDVFEDKFPEYKSDSDVFIPRASIKEAVKEAFSELQPESWNTTPYSKFPPTDDPYSFPKPYYVSLRKAHLYHSKGWRAYCLLCKGQ